MGGNLPNTPHFLPHSEKSGGYGVQKTILDWVGFTSSVELNAVFAAIQVVWPLAMFTNNSKGIKGFPDSYSVSSEGVKIGTIGTGAKHGRTYVSMTGDACALLDDESIGMLVEVLSMPEFDARLNRVDIALDFFHGELTWDHALWAYDRGSYKGPRGGRNPRKKVIDLSADGENLGRTLYIGVREGACYGRIYEKGLEVFANMPEDLRKLSLDREAETGQGPNADTWLRLEVEYKRVENDLTLDILQDRDRYFAGAYPYYADALGLSDGLRPSQLKKDIDVELDRMIFNARRSYGSLIHSLQQMGFNANDVVQQLSSGRNNDRLVRSGLLGKVQQTLSEKREKDPDFDIPF